MGEVRHVLDFLGQIGLGFTFPAHNLTINKEHFINLFAFYIIKRDLVFKKFRNEIQLSIILIFILVDF